MRLKDEVAREAAPAKPTRQPAGPNKTEAKYAAECLRGLDARYEALTFHLGCGHSYTPDWVVFAGGRPVTCHEVKGTHRFHSHQRARLAFDQARVEIPGLLWVWAVLQKDGSWKHTVTRATPGKVGTDGTGTGKELGSAAEGRKGRFRANGEGLAADRPPPVRFFPALSNPDPIPRGIAQKVTNEKTNERNP